MAENKATTGKTEQKAKAKNAKQTNKTVQKPRVTKKPQGKTIFALDIGTRTVIGVIGTMDGDVFRISDTEVIPHKKRVMIDGQVEDIAGVSEIAKQVKKNLEDRNRMRLTEVSIAAAGRALKTVRTEMEFDVSDKNTLSADMIRSMEIETIQKAQSENIEKYADDHIIFYCVGHSVVKYTLDGYKISTLEGHKGDKATVEIIAAFLPSAVVEGLYAVTDSIGLKVKSMTLEPIAAMNAIIPPEIRLINIALCDIGAGTSDIAVAKDGAIVAYAMATVAGDEISEEIVKNFLVDFNMAESMKLSSAQTDGDIVYKDIFGIEKKVSKDEFFAKCATGVDSLADVICQTVTEVNGTSPAAMFLIGGGSKANGLPDMIAKKLDIESGRVAVGGQEFMKNVDTGGRKLGPEFVTPVGIALTSGTDMSYDFSSIMLNGESIRVFDTKSLSIFELLGAAGYKTSKIMGHSGASLRYTLNGRSVTIKGTPYVPAEITKNGEPAALTTKITQGDRIVLVPCVNGEDARQTVADIIGENKISRVSINFCSEKYEVGYRVYCGENEVDADYEIQPLDNIIIKNTASLGAFLMQLGGDTESAEIYVNGKLCAEDYILCDGDEIGFEAAKEPEQAEPEKAPENIENVVAEEAENEAVEETEDNEQTVDDVIVHSTANTEEMITVTFNGVVRSFPKKKNGDPYLMLDFFAMADIDTENHSGQLTIMRGGKNANLTDIVEDGDNVIIRQEVVQFGV